MVMPSSSLYSIDLWPTEEQWRQRYKKDIKEIYLKSEVGARSWAFRLITVYSDLLNAIWMSSNNFFNILEILNEILPNAGQYLIPFQCNL